MGTSRAKGTKAESALTAYLNSSGWPDADRAPLRGRFDKGDVKWLPWIAVEVKNVRTPAYGQWLKEAEAERVNLGAEIGVVIHKPHGTALTDQGNWHTIMKLDTFLAMVRARGGT